MGQRLYVQTLYTVHHVIVSSYERHLHFLTIVKPVTGLRVSCLVPKAVVKGDLKRWMGDFF